MDVHPSEWAIGGSCDIELLYTVENAREGRIMTFYTPVEDGTYFLITHSGRVDGDFMSPCPVQNFDNFTWNDSKLHMHLPCDKEKCSTQVLKCTA